MAALLGEVVASLRQRAAELLPLFSAKELPLLVNALGKLPASRRGDDRGGRRFGGMCVAAAGARLGECTPQGLALLLTGLPKLFRDDEGPCSTADDDTEEEEEEEPIPVSFLLALRDAVAAQLALGEEAVPFLPQDLALLLNGFTSLGFHPGVVFLHVHATRVAAALPRCHPQDIALLWVAYSRLGWQPPPPAMAAMRDRAWATMGTYRPQDFANVLQAMGRMGYAPGEAFLRRAVQRLEPLLPRFNAHSLACVLHALALLGHVPPPHVRRRLLARVRESLVVPGVGGGFKTEELCMVAHALGQLPELAAVPPAPHALDDSVEGGGAEGQQQQEQQQQQEEEEEGIAQCLAAAVERRMGALPPRDLAMSIRALSRIGLRPVPPSFLAAAERRLPAAAGALAGWEAALTLHALGRLTLASESTGEEAAEWALPSSSSSARPALSEAARRLFKQAVARRGELGAQEVSLALNSAVHLGWPGESAVRGLCERMEDLLEAAAEAARRPRRQKLQLQPKGAGRDAVDVEDDPEAAARARRRRRLPFTLDEEVEEEQEEEGGKPGMDHGSDDEPEDDEENGPALTSQGIALLLGALGHLGYPPSRRLQRLLPPAVGARLRAGDFTAMDLGMSLRGLANLPPLLGGGGGGGGGGRAFVVALADQLLQGLERRMAAGRLALGAQDVGMVANSLAKLGLRRHGLLATLASALRPRLGEATSQALASATNAFARLRFHPGAAFLAALEEEVVERLLLPPSGHEAGIDTQSLGLLLWSLAVLDASALPSGEGRGRSASDNSGSTALPPSLLERGVGARLLPELAAQLSRLEAAEKRRRQQLQQQQQQQQQQQHRTGGKPSTVPAWDPLVLETLLCQALQLLMYARGHPALRSTQGLAELQAVVRPAWARVAPQRARPVPSALHRDVMAALDAAGAQFAAEVEAGDGGVFSLDVVLEPVDSPPGSRRPVVLEVDGPTHYFADDPATATGDTVFKQRLLQLERDAGGRPKWAAVVSLTLWEWQGAGPRGPREKLALVEAKLGEAGLSLDDFRASPVPSAAAAAAAIPRKQAAGGDGKRGAAASSPRESSKPSAPPPSKRGPKGAAAKSSSNSGAGGDKSTK